MSPSTTSASCAHLANPNPYTVALAAIILLGILISYLPQHIKIIQRRSSDGLSPWWVLLGGLSSIAAIGNILVLPASRADMRCCRQISGGECAAALLGVGQIGLQWGCFMFIVLLFLTFFQPTTTIAKNAASTSPPQPGQKPRREALTVGITLLTTILLVLLTSLYILSTTPTTHPGPAQTWANTLGTTAGILSMIQWAPQIFFTWRRRSVGSLSILTMIIQVPGAFLFAFSLWLRVGWVGWSAWFVFLVTGCLQGCLLGLAVYYWFRGGGQIGEEVQEEVAGVGGEVEGEVEAVDERTALLGSGDAGHHKNGVESGGRGGDSGTSYAAIMPQQRTDSSGGGDRIT